MGSFLSHNKNFKFRCHFAIYGLAYTIKWNYQHVNAMLFKSDCHNMSNYILIH